MNPKQKNIALLIGFILVLWLAHQMSFSKTLNAKKQYVALKNEVLLFENSSQKLLQLQKENQYYDSILKSKRISTDKSFQNNLLPTINSFADSTNIKVVSFQNPHVFIADNASFSTYAFTISGSFIKITELIYILEQRYKLGKVISVDFKKKKNFRRNSYFLECTVLLQQIESI